MRDRQRKEDTILNCCALRFNGYSYQRDHSSFSADEVISNFLNTGQWQASELELLASFFLLQRSLGKWALVYEPLDGKYWQAFRSLFLRVNYLEIPENYQMSDYCQQWEQQYLPQLDACVMLIQTRYKEIAERQGVNYDAGT